VDALNVNEYLVLKFLQNSDKTVVTSREIAKSTCLHRSTVNRILTRLGREGIVNTVLLSIGGRNQRVVVLTSETLSKIEERLKQYEDVIKGLGISNWRQLLESVCSEGAAD